VLVWAVAASVAVAFADSSIVVLASARPLRRVQHVARRRLVGDHVVQPRRRGRRRWSPSSSRRLDPRRGAQVGLALFTARVDRLCGLRVNLPS
jgi:hypothetical protein